MHIKAILISGILIQKPIFFSFFMLYKHSVLEHARQSPKMVRFRNPWK